MSEAIQLVKKPLLHFVAVKNGQKFSFCNEKTEFDARSRASQLWAVKESIKKHTRYPPKLPEFIEITKSYHPPMKEQEKHAAWTRHNAARLPAPESVTNEWRSKWQEIRAGLN